MPKCVTDILIVEPFTWHSVVKSIQLPPNPPLPESLVYALQKKKTTKKKQQKDKKISSKNRQHYFLQKLTSRLNQGASYQYYRVEDVVESVTFVHFTPHPSQSGGVFYPPFCPKRPERRGWEWPRKAAAKGRGVRGGGGGGGRRSLLVSQANRGY